MGSPSISSFFFLANYLLKKSCYLSYTISQLVDVSNVPLTPVFLINWELDLAVGRIQEVRSS